MTCPKGAGPVRVLFDSEKGDPAGPFDAGSTWLRAPDESVFPPVSANATSGHTSWFSREPQDTTVSSLTMHPVALPAGRPAYLWFQQWRLLESGTNVDGTQVNYDARHRRGRRRHPWRSTPRRPRGCRGSTGPAT